MKYLDRILEHLQDSEWHSVEEVGRETSTPDDNLKEILCFLQERSLIVKENERIKITPEGLNFLELPS